MVPDLQHVRSLQPALDQCPLHVELGVTGEQEAA